MAKTYKRVRTQYPGVFYRESKRSGKVFYIAYRRPGERRTIEDKLLGYDWTPAKANVERTRRMEGKTASNSEKRNQERLAKLAEKNRPTLERLLEIYLEDKECERGRPLKSAKQLGYVLNKHYKDLKHKTPPELAQTDALRIRRDILKRGGAHKTVAGVLGLLHTIIRHGEDRGLCEPLRFKLPIPKRREFNRTTERLSPRQLDALLDALEHEPPMVANFFRMALFTGMRRGEINKLTWADCDFEFSTLTLRDAKSGRDEVIPMPEPVRTILEDQRAIKDMRNSEAVAADVVFFSETGCPCGRSEKMHTLLSKRIRERAGLPDTFRMCHGLRHVFGTLHAIAGTPLPVLMKLLTHKSLDVTERYIEVALEDTQRAAELTADIIEQHRTRNSHNVIRLQERRSA